MKNKLENVIPARHHEVRSTLGVYAGIQLTIFSKWIPAFAGMTLVFYLLFLPSSAFAQTATLSLSPSSGTVNRSCTFTVDVNLNTGGAQTDGTDAILSYDTSRLSATLISPGTIYPEYPGNSIREDLGKVTISGLASVTQPYSGQGKLGTVTFAVKDAAPTGVTQIKFDFNSGDKSNTTDSNVVERGGNVSDILNSVVDGSYTIGTGTCSSGTVGTGTGTGAGGKGGVSDASGSGEVKVPFKELPQGGTKEFTFMLGIVGATLTVLGIIGMVLL